MEDVTDPPFRMICKGFGADLLYTEFIASEGLIRDAKKSLAKLHFSEEERPIGIQIFGHDIESMVKAARIAESAEPDLIDLNFGCPVKKIVNKGAGAALLNDIPKMVRMTGAVVKATRMPVTVKTRLGWDPKHQDILEIALRLQDEGIQAITIHGRTRDQHYCGKADWTLIGEVKHHPRIMIPVIGNGDIDSPEKALYMKQTYGVDGIMIGRAAVGNPWLFKRIRHYFDTGELLAGPTLAERIETVESHLQLAIRLKGERTAVFEMRKLYAGYFRGVSHFKDLRMKLMTITEWKDIQELLTSFRQVDFTGPAL
jgi:nifR3 family TIM-barrel protein